MWIAFHVCFPLVDDRRELIQARAEREGVRRAQRGILLAAPRQPTQRADADERSDFQSPAHDVTYSNGQATKGGAGYPPTPCTVLTPAAGGYPPTP